MFQWLSHSMVWEAPRWRVLDAAHQKRNLADYEGYVDIAESMLLGLSALVTGQTGDVEE